MSISKTIVAVSLLALVAGSFLALTAGASAHERRPVGSYTFVVGWLNEPALVNEPNAIALGVTRTADASPVEGLERTLKAEASLGSDKLAVELKPRFRMPGAYDGRVLPTKEGSYTFTFTGTVENAPINEKFTGGPGTFSLIEAPLTFPLPLPQIQSIDESLKGVEQRIVSLEAADAKGAADTAMAIGIAGVIIGILGLGAGVFALTRRPSTASR